MKKIYLILMLILITGCGVKDEPLKDNPKEEVKEEIKEETEPIYQDENPLKIALYKGGNNYYKKIDEFISPLESYKDIATFSIVLSNENEVNGSIKDLYNNVKSNYDDFSKYKIGYNINFTVKDGTTYNETILKPLDLFDYSFHKYLYIWLYDDINTTGWHSHIEKNEYTDTTVMSSIKLMSTESSRDVVDGFKITAFTYDTEDDFNEDGNYRGISSHTLTIKYGG